MTTPRLLVVIPCLNEAAHLPELLAGIAKDSLAQRIVVADGGSTDASREIVSAMSASNPRIVLLENSSRVQSAAVNLAIDRFGDETDFFVRVDAHAAYPDDFLARLIQAQQEFVADSVTVSMRATAQRGRCFQSAAASAQNSVLGAGGSPHRKAGGRRWVDHGHHALFRTSAFRAAGGYDETYTHNEDAEFDARLTAQGGKILLAGDLVISYFPRATARTLARQYYHYGRGRARTAAARGQSLKLRQLAPTAVAPAVAVAAILGPFFPLAAAPAAAWLALCLAFGVFLGVRERSLCACASGVAAAIMHAAWSAGFLRQALFERRP